MHKKIWISTSFFTILMLACSISFVETPPPAINQAPGNEGAPMTPTPQVDAGPTVVDSAATESVQPGSNGSTSGLVTGKYGVILVSSKDVLNIRAGPGVEYAVISRFKSTDHGIIRTGRSFKVGDQEWLEVQNPRGATGWVNGNFLTEYIDPEVFCEDGSVLELMDKLVVVMSTFDGTGLSEMVSPLHGLEVRYWRYGNPAHYDRSEAMDIFTSTSELNWGPAPGSGQDTLGAFSEIPLPKLQEVLTTQPERHCNDSLDLATFSLEPWPNEFTNINFYNLYKPGSPGVELDWRAWLVGIEYVQGTPYLFSLIHFQWEP
ncbi:MAG: hypothetical protein A2Y54_06685 [Chloroflexi bacterium RBG_16_51_16]|nr:MAG: hypothetical protein A2Y54_06685 [Chloroflexi bacterium RBG_16_51_16]